MVAVTSVDVAGWESRLSVMLTALGSLFVRPEPRRTACAYVRGLLSAVERKNSWWLAEHVGDGGPHAMQRLLTTAKWDAEAARDRVRADVVEHLGPDGVLIFDLCRHRDYAERLLCGLDVQGVGASCASA